MLGGRAPAGVYAADQGSGGSAACSPLYAHEAHVGRYQVKILRCAASCCWCGHKMPPLRLVTPPDARRCRRRCWHLSTAAAGAGLLLATTCLLHHATGATAAGQGLQCLNACSPAPTSAPQGPEPETLCDAHHEQACRCWTGGNALFRHQTGCAPKTTQQAAACVACAASCDTNTTHCPCPLPSHRH